MNWGTSLVLSLYPESSILLTLLYRSSVVLQVVRLWCAIISSVLFDQRIIQCCPDSVVAHLHVVLEHLRSRLGLHVRLINGVRRVLNSKESTSSPSKWSVYLRNSPRTSIRSSREGFPWYFWSTLSLVWPAKAQWKRIAHLLIRFNLYLIPLSFSSNCSSCFSSPVEAPPCCTALSWSSSLICSRVCCSASRVSRSARKSSRKCYFSAIL